MLNCCLAWPLLVVGGARSVSFFNGWEMRGPTTHSTSHFLFWLLSSFLWLWIHLPCPPVPHAGSRPSGASPEMSRYSSDHGNKTLCPHLRFLFPRSLKGCFPQGNPLLALLGSGSSSVWAASISFSVAGPFSLLQNPQLLHSPSGDCGKPMGLPLQISIL